jgi:hypothetical protein
MVWCLYGVPQKIDQLLSVIFMSVVESGTYTHGLIIQSQRRNSYFKTLKRKDAGSLIIFIATKYKTFWTV